MRYERFFYTLLGFTIVILFLGACSLLPSSPSVDGSFILYSTGNIFEIPTDLNAEEANAVELRIAGPNIRKESIAISPDRRYLTYSIGSELFLYDLYTGKVKTLFSGSTCVSWSPDYSRFSYITPESDGNKLFVYNASSKASTFVYAPPSAVYEDNNLRYGGISCGDWIANDRFIFNRFVGAMPSQITQVGEQELGANTTTLAIMDKSIKLIDSPNKLDIFSISDDRKHIFFEREANLYSHSFLEPSLNDFGSLDQKVFVSRYISQFLITDSEFIYGDINNQIYFVDLQTFEERVGPKIPDDVYVYIWVGDPRDNLIATIQDGGWMYVQDINTKRRLTLLDGGDLSADIANLGLKEGGFEISSRIIGWLPPK